MRKINNLRDLQYHKRQLKLEQQLLEYKIKESWNNLKEELKPATIVKEISDNINHYEREENKNGNSEINTLLSHTISVVKKKVINKVLDKFGKLFKK